MRLSLETLANLAPTIADGDFKLLNETLDHLDLSRDMRSTVLIVIAARLSALIAMQVASGGTGKPEDTLKIIADSTLEHITMLQAATPEVST